MWTKILYKGINKSNFSLHQLVIKRKEKQNKRNVKHDDVKTNVIYFLHERRLLRHDVLQLRLLYL